ncbi:MAG: DUF4340 domain-containing protein [Elusimicrobia bacterium]|nr:DUF4340 domain-containing protein [Elusimicrobiota bacterium]
MSPPPPPMPKRFLVLASCALILSGAAGLLLWRSSRPPKAQEPLKELDKGSVSRIEIRKGERSVSLESRDGSWRLAQPPDGADPSACQELLTGLFRLSIGSRLSDDPSSYPDYELNDSSASRVRLFVQGKSEPVFDGYFGKTAMGHDSHYFRYESDKPVYIASGVDSYQMNRSANDFRQRQLSSIDLGSAGSIRLTYGNQAFELRKSSAGWSGSLPKDRLDALISTLSALRVSDFGSGSEKVSETGLAKPLISVELQAGERKARWMIGKAKVAAKGEKPSYYYARVEGRDALLLLSAYDVDNILKSLAGKTPSA